MNSEVERLTAVLRAEANGTDLKISKDADGRIYVCCEDNDGNLFADMPEEQETNLDEGSMIDAPPMDQIVEGSAYDGTNNWVEATEGQTSIANNEHTDWVKEMDNEETPDANDDPAQLPDAEADNDVADVDFDSNDSSDNLFI